MNPASQILKNVKVPTLGTHRYFLHVYPATDPCTAIFEPKQRFRKNVLTSAEHTDSELWRCPR